MKRHDMPETPIPTRKLLHTGILASWLITLVFLVLGGGYRSFIRPSFVVFLWAAIAILLVFIISGITETAHRKVKFEDITRSGFLLLPLMALWLAYGKPLGSYAYTKKAIAEQPAVVEMAPSSPRPEASASNKQAPLEVTIFDLIDQPQEYQGKLIVTEGMAMRQKTFRRDANANLKALQPGSFILFRFLIVCCVADSQPLGMIVESPKANRVADNEWYRITGRFSLNKNKLGVISHAVVSRMETPPELPYLYAAPTMRTQYGASPPKECQKGATR